MSYSSRFHERPPMSKCSNYLSIYLFIYACLYVSILICLSVFLSVCLSVFSSNIEYITDTSTFLKSVSKDQDQYEYQV